METKSNYAGEQVLNSGEYELRPEFRLANTIGSTQVLDTLVFYQTAPSGEEQVNYHFAWNPKKNFIDFVKEHGGKIRAVVANVDMDAIDKLILDIQSKKSAEVFNLEHLSIESLRDILCQRREE
jgi:hypothetical protein